MKGEDKKIIGSSANELNLDVTRDERIVNLDSNRHGLLTVLITPYPENSNGRNLPDTNSKRVILGLKRNCADIES